MPDKMKEIGAMWVRKSKKGMTYYSVTFGEDIPADSRGVAFKNTWKKEGESTPDYRIYESVPMQQQPPTPAPPPVVDDEEIPF